MLFTYWCDWGAKLFNFPFNLFQNVNKFYFRRKSATCCSTWIVTSPWGQIQRELEEMLAKSPSVIYQWSRSNRLVRECWRLPVWYPSESRVRKRIWGTTGLSVWPWNEGSLWTRSFWVQSHGMWDQVQPTCVHERQILFNQTHLLLLGEGKDVDIIYLDFSKAFWHLLLQYSLG